MLVTPKYLDPQITVQQMHPILGVHSAFLLLGFTGEFPVVKAKLEELNSYVLTPDGTVHRSLYCSPSYFAEDYAVKPIYA